MNRRVIVTGSSRGIGAAIARKLAAGGFRLTVHCRAKRAEADALADALGVVVL